MIHPRNKAMIWMTDEMDKMWEKDQCIGLTADVLQSWVMKAAERNSHEAFEMVSLLAVVSAAIENHVCDEDCEDGGDHWATCMDSLDRLFAAEYFDGTNVIKEFLTRLQQPLLLDYKRSWITGSNGLSWSNEERDLDIAVWKGLEFLRLQVVAAEVSAHLC